MEGYMEAAALASNHFQLDIFPKVWSQTTQRRLIKCCCKLGHYTQAAILCQLLQPVDYETAFSILKEHASRTLDSLFPYFWDMTIIEYLIRILDLTTHMHTHKLAGHIPQVSWPHPLKLAGHTPRVSWPHPTANKVH